MRSLTVVYLIFLSLVISIGGRFLYIQLQNERQKQLTHELCEIVGNYLETGSLREAYEGFQQGLSRAGYEGACVSVIDNGRSFAPNCIDPGKSYQTVLCRAEGNREARAEFHFPIVSFFSKLFFLSWCAIFMFATAILTGFKVVSKSIFRQVVSALDNRLFKQQGNWKKTSFLSGMIDSLVAKLGLDRNIELERDHFEAELKRFEQRIREESGLRVKNEVEAKQSREYIERVHQIRHDIRSPLSSLLSLEERLKPNELEGQTLRSAIRKIQLMLDDLSQVDRAEKDPTLTVIEVMVEEAVSILRPKFFQAKEITLIVSYEVTRLSPVMVVQEDLRKVFDNLLENAFDAVAFGGTVRITVSQEGANCHISIEDDGCGIPAEVVPKLFVKGATFAKVGGTGLGLYQTRRTVVENNGSIEYTALAKGSQFKVTLPLAQVGVAFVGLPKTDRLFVIDDDPIVAEALRVSGYELNAVASSYSEGKTLLRGTLEAGASILVDQRLGPDDLGTDLVGECGLRPEMVLCTNDFSSLDVIRRAKQIGLKILPKPLCFLAESPMKKARRSLTKV